MRTKSKKLFSLFLFIAFTCFNISASTDQPIPELPSVEPFVKDTKKFVKKKLFIEPSQQGCLAGRVINGLIIIGTIALCSHDALIIWKGYDPQNYDCIPPKSLAFYFGIGVATFLGFNIFLNKSLCFKANRAKTFLDFVKNWESYKKHTPKDLHEYFNNMYIAYQNGSLQKEDIDSLVSWNEIREFLDSKEKKTWLSSIINTLWRK
jgi:hypothetical protein